MHNRYYISLCDGSSGSCVVLGDAPHKVTSSMNSRQERQSCSFRRLQNLRLVTSLAAPRILKSS